MEIVVVIVGGMVILLFRQLRRRRAKSPAVRTRRLTAEGVLSADVKQSIHDLLTREFSYYSLLKEAEQQEFVLRCVDIKSNLEFEAREELELTDEMSLLLSASMAQLTFGFKDYVLSNFKKIIIYPSTFYSKLIEAEVKGLTYGNGFISLSWSHFEHGYEHGSDKLNLGLHEFAHALLLDKAKQFDVEAFDMLEKMANFIKEEVEFTGMSDSLFRDYGLTNMHEFWAVSVEVYFENPVELAAKYPRLYRVMCVLLKQDLASRVLGIDSQIA